MASNTIGILSSAMQVNKKKMDLAMQNISNSDNPIYTAKSAEISSIVVDGSPQGVKIDSITRRTDDLMQRSLYHANASSASSQYITDACKEITDSLASPLNTTDSLYNNLRAFDDSINTLALNPGDISMRNDASNKASKLVGYISNMAMGIQEKRYNVDHELAKSLQDVNAILNGIHEINVRRMLIQNNTLEAAQLSDETDAALMKLSNYFDIDYKFNDKGFVSVSIRNNGQEIVGKQLYSFEYEPANSTNDFLEDRKLNPLYLTSKSVDGHSVIKSVLIDGYKTDDMSYNLCAGKIYGLLQVRDDILPSVSETLDQLSLNVAESFNTVHNKGNGSIPVSSLSGTVYVAGDDKIIGNGNVIINPMDQYGKPLNCGSGRIPALNLDLSQFTTNTTKGSFNVAGLVNEINQYFSAASTGNRLEIDGFHSINIACISSASDGSNMVLDFDLQGYSEKPGVSNMQFRINSASASDYNGLPVSANVTKPGNFDVVNGAHVRSGINGGMQIALGNTTSNYPITITLDITTTVNGVETNATVEYTVKAPTTSELTNTNGLSGKRFTPSALINSDTSETKLLASGMSDSVIKASIVDENGILVTNPNQKGFLKIESTLKSNTVAIDESNSRIVSTTNQEIKGGLSYAFGLNDIFVFKKPDGSKVISPESTKNVAAYMTLSDQVKSSPNAISIGKIEAYRAGINGPAPALFFAAGIGDTSLVNDYAKISTTNVNFNATSDIDARNTTIYNYASDIISANNIRTINNEVISNRDSSLKSMLENDYASVRGVNIDDEAIKIIQYQQNYSIAAKFVNTSNNLLQTLIDNIN